MRTEHCDFKEFESLVGKLAHACLGIPGGTALLPPLYKALHSAKNKGPSNVQIKSKGTQHSCIQDLRTLIRIISLRPTLCSQLVPGMPAYIGFCDACKYGAGGVWVSGKNTLRPVVWRLKWPPEVVKAFEEGKLTINDLEMAGLVLQSLILEGLVDVANVHSAV